MAYSNANEIHLHLTFFKNLYESFLSIRQDGVDQRATFEGNGSGDEPVRAVY